MHSPAVRADVSKIAAFRRTSARIFNTTGRQERALTSFLRIAALGLSTSARIRVSLSASLSLSLLCALSLGTILGCSGAPRNEAFFFRLQVRRPGGRPGGGRALGERQVREKGGGYSKVWRMRGRGRVAR